MLDEKVTRALYSQGADFDVFFLQTWVQTPPQPSPTEEEKNSTHEIQKFTCIILPPNTFRWI